jgi:hypothetical protein
LSATEISARRTGSDSPAGSGAISDEGVVDTAARV